MAVVDKHVDARMARIELAVQRVQMFIVLVVSVAVIIWGLGFVETLWPDADWTTFAWSRGGALALGLLLAFAVAKLIGYPLQVLERA